MEEEEEEEMAAELFSTNLPHSHEVKVKKSLIQQNEPEPPIENTNEEEGDVQPNSNNDREDGDSWTDTQPTLRER